MMVVKNSVDSSQNYTVYTFDKDGCTVAITTYGNDGLPGIAIQEWAVIDSVVTKD